MAKRVDIDTDLADAAEAARILGISVENLHVRMHRGQIPETAYVRVGSLLIFLKKEIIKLAKQQAKAARPRR